MGTYVPDIHLIVLRAVAAGFTAFLISVFLGKLTIRYQKKRAIGEEIRPEGPIEHHVKAGTPTVGGICFIAAAVTASAIWIRSTPVLLIFTASIVGFGVIGLADDLLKLMKKDNDGLKAHYKIALQIIITYALLYMISSYFKLGTRVFIPWKSYSFIDLGSWYHLAAVFFAVGLVNSTNIADGLDGLAAGLGTIAFLAVISIGVLFFNVANETMMFAFLSDERAELLVAASSMTGALLGFLWYNASPAQLFMGDTGSMAIGGALAVIGLATRNEILMLIISGVFVLESISVILQVGSFKIRGKRIFKMAPVHHHFEQIGWREEKVVMRLWIVSAICAGVAMVAALAML
jgi:phospho-N-acetylmuramoyl-pentapeptide-transferase